MLVLVLAHAFEALMVHIPFQNLHCIPRISKEVLTFCSLNGWTCLVESRMICFKDGLYLSRPTGWVHLIETVSIKVPKNLKKRPRPGFHFVVAGNKRTKVFLKDGKEYIKLGPDSRFQTVHASDTKTSMDKAMVQRHNTYWATTM